MTDTLAVLPETELWLEETGSASRVFIGVLRSPVRQVDFHRFIDEPENIETLKIIAAGLGLPDGIIDRRNFATVMFVPIRAHGNQPHLIAKYQASVTPDKTHLKMEFLCELDFDSDCCTVYLLAMWADRWQRL